MLIARRRFLIGAVSLLAAPAIIRPGILMPIKPWLEAEPAFPTLDLGWGPMPVRRADGALLRASDITPGALIRVTPGEDGYFVVDERDLKSSPTVLGALVSEPMFIQDNVWDMPPMKA